MTLKNETIIIGGGLAGLVCAIHLRKVGHQVLLIEKQEYPQHKVCGEYVSNEVLSYLRWLECDPFVLDPSIINYLSFSSSNGETIDCKLPLGGFGISRYVLDNFLYEKARSNGCEFLTDSAINVTFRNNAFIVNTGASGELMSEVVIGAYGKRTGLDQKLKRKFMLQKSPWLAIKAHYNGQFDDDLVALHTFKGGYCGVSKIEDGKINICYLVDYENFKMFKNINDFQEHVLFENPHLKRIFENSKIIFDLPLSISQISFERKEPVHKHMLMIGDTAGLIHPLCGNGMAMAIHSAKICAELCSQFLGHGIDRDTLERTYQKTWNSNFKSRLLTGSVISRLIRNKTLFGPIMGILINFPSLLPLIIKRTHGKPISIV